MTELKLKLWSNVLEASRKPKRSMSKPFVFTLGFVTGVTAAGFIGHLADVLIDFFG